MEMKIKLVLITILLIYFQTIFAQEQHSTGPIPKIENYKPATIINNSDNLAWLALGHSSLDNYTVSLPLPSGTPFTHLFNWAPSTFASSMTANPQGSYYITETGPPARLHQMTYLGEVTLVGEIIGMGAEKPNGIAYNLVNQSFYIASSLNLYSFNPVNLTATLIGPFNTGGNIIDLCFNLAGVCFAYDVVTDCAYTINILTGEASLLGPLGYDANFGQGMSYDIETQTIYLSAFNNSSFTGQLRTMNPQTGMTTLITDWGLIQLAPFAVVGFIPPPCPVGYPSNPNPPNGATGLPLTGNTLSWTNGIGTTNVEVWFGPSGNFVKVYDGPAVTQYVLPTLSYSTTYTWYIVCKDAICGTQGPTWSFTTMQDPNLIDWCDEFYNLNNWTIIGPLGTTNWSTSSTSNAGGTPPELRFSWTPSFNGESKIRSVPFPLLNNTGTNLSFNFFFDWYADPSGVVTVGITYDGGVTSTILYSVTNPTGNVGPLVVDEWFVTPSSGSQNAQIEITFSGNSFNNDNIYWDNVCIYWCLSCQPPNAPGNLTAQVIFNPSPQVQLGWQDNSWNESGFRVNRKNGQPNDPGDYVLVGTIGQNQTQYIDATVMPESTYTYRVFAYNQFGQNGSNTTTIAVPVPVELISFTAEVDNNVVTLFWQTATETNNQGFEILRSNQNDNVGWEKIGFVEGKGTTTEIQSYSFTDNSEPGKYKYRLKQIDYNGTFAYSPEVEAEVKAPNVFSLEQNYPNPFNPNTKIKYTIPDVALRQAQSDILVTLKVYDILGNEVATLVNEEQSPGVYEIEFNPESSIKHPASGIYFYQIKAGSFIETKKMIILK